MAAAIDRRLWCSAAGSSIGSPTSSATGGATGACGLSTTGTAQLVACYAITVWVESGSFWHALVQEALHVRLQEGPHELPLFGGGLLGSRVRLEFAQELLARRYLVGAA